MTIIMVIVVVAVLVFAITINKSKQKETMEEIEEEDISESDECDECDVSYLKVFYKHNEITKNQIIQVYDTYACFKVEGYNSKGYRKVLNPDKMKWSCPCGCVHFDKETGLENCISCSVRGDYKRNIAVKYANKITFSFVLQFK